METLINPRENFYFGLSLFLSISVYLLLFAWIIYVPEEGWIILIYIVLFAVFFFLLRGFLIGNLKGNAIRVSEKQFPEVYRLAQQYSSQMGLKPVPAIFILQSGGLLNAFATRFLGRNFVVIYSEVLELAYGEGLLALGFVICHELAHIKRGHLTKRKFITPALIMPFLGKAYSRACEYTCDRFGAYFQQDGALAGLMVLAAGIKLYHIVDKTEFMSQANSEKGFWTWLAEIFSSHPQLTKRAKALDDSLKMHQPAIA